MSKAEPRTHSLAAGPRALMNLEGQRIRLDIRREETTVLPEYDEIVLLISN